MLLLPFRQTWGTGRFGALHSAFFEQISRAAVAFLHSVYFPSKSTRHAWIFSALGRAATVMLWNLVTERHRAVRGISGVHLD